jgi:hypothetical protein
MDILITPKNVCMIAIPKFFKSLDLPSVNARKEELKTITMAAGAFSTYLTREKVMRTAEDPGFTKDQRDRLKATGEGYWILMYEDFLVNHTDAEKKAIVSHEMAHIEMGHIPKDFVSVDGKTLIIDNLDYEMAADRVAAIKTSKQAMATAIRKSLGAAVEKAGHIAAILGKDFNQSEAFDAAIGGEEIVTRLKALS